MITRDEAQAIAVAVVKECRLDVDEELKKLHQADKDNAWSEEKAEAIAIRAAKLAVPESAKLTREGLVNDVKIEIADGAIGILRRAVQVIALFIVGIAFYIGSKKWPWE